MSGLDDKKSARTKKNGVLTAYSINDGAVVCTSIKNRCFETDWQSESKKSAI